MSEESRLRESFETYLASSDEEAMEYLVQSTRRRLLAVARRIGAPQDAEDSVQAAYLALIRRRPDAEILPWLITVVVRIAYRRKALEKRQLDSARALAIAREKDPVFESAHIAERGEQLRRNVAALPAKYRDAIVLHHLEGLDTAAVARLLDRPVSTVRTHLLRGRRLLQRRARTLWTFGLLWLLRDAIASGGMMVVNKKLAMTGAVILLALGAGLLALGNRDNAVLERAQDQTEGAVAFAVVADSNQEGDGEDTSALRPVASGLVQDEEGRPIEGAVVDLFVQGTSAADYGWNDKLPLGVERATTNDRGLFRIPLKNGAPTSRLLIVATGFSPAIERVQGDSTHFVVTLRRSAALTGFVTNMQGAAVVGARVRWWTFLTYVPIERTALSDEQGRYRIDGLPSPWQSEGRSAPIVQVEAEGYAPLAVPAVQPTRRGPDTVVMNLFLVHGATIRGRVYNGHTGQPLEGARVFVKSAPMAKRVLTWAERRTDAEGEFVAQGMPADGFHRVPTIILSARPSAGIVRVELEGFAASTIDFEPAEDGETIEVKVTCWPVGRVRGRVVDGRNRPLKGVTVRAASQVQTARSVIDMGGAVNQATTDDRGRYDLPNSPGPGQLMLSFFRDGWPGGTVGVNVRPGETVEAEDMVWRGPTLPAVTVNVVNADGQPVWNSRVSLTPRGGMRWTDRNGNARLYSGKEGDAWVEARSIDSGPRRKHLVLKQDQPQTVRLVLDATRTIEGEVRNPDGTPATGVRVFAEGAPETWSDRAGRFVLRQLPEGKFDVTAIRADISATARGTRNGVRAGTKGVVLTLSPVELPASVSVEGSVVVKDTGKSVPVFAATLSTGGFAGGFARAIRTAPGQFRFDRVRTGIWTLRVSARGFGTYEQRGLVLRQGAHIPVLRIELVHGAQLQGRVVGGEVSSIALVRADGFKTTVAFVSPQGKFVVGGLPTGRYRPQFVGLRSLAASHDSVIDIAEGARTVSFNVQLVPGKTVQLGGGHHRIVAPDGTVLWDCDRLISVGLPLGTYKIDGQTRLIER